MRFDMTDHFKELTHQISHQVGLFSKDSPAVMKAFHELSQTSTKSGELDEKFKELIALAIGIAKQCEGCIGFHTKKLVKLGVTRGEFTEMLNVAVYMGGGPALMYAMDALKAFEEFNQ